MNAEPDGILDDVDAEILDELAGLIARVDPPPAGMDDRVRFAITVRALHAEVAELTRGEPLAVRGEGESEHDGVPTDSITFTAGSVSLMISVRSEPDDETCRIDGWVTRGGARVEVVTAGATISAVADDAGRFAVAAVPRGSVYFLVRVSEDSRPVITPTLEV